MPTFSPEQSGSLQSFPQFPVGQTPLHLLFRVNEVFRWDLKTMSRVDLHGLEREGCKTRVVRGGFGQVGNVGVKLRRSFSTPTCCGLWVVHKPKSDGRSDRSPWLRIESQSSGFS